MGTEIPRDTDQLDQHDETQRDQGEGRPDGTRPRPDSRDGKHQKQWDESELRPHQDPLGYFNRSVVVGEMAVRKAG